MLLDLQDGQMTGQFGLDHVPASPSQEVDSESPLTTKDISGQNSFDLLNSANLPLSQQVPMILSGLTPCQFKEETENQGELNPEFVCWLMGFPHEWISCAP